MSCHLGRGFAGTASTFGGVRDSETHFSGNAAHYKKVEILAKLNFNLGCLACFCHYTPRTTHTRGIGKVLLAIYKKNDFRSLISEEYWAQQRSPDIDEWSLTTVWETLAVQRKVGDWLTGGAGRVALYDVSKAKLWKNQNEEINIFDILFFEFDSADLWLLTWNVEKCFLKKLSFTKIS